MDAVAVAARWFQARMDEPWPVEDVLLDEAVRSALDAIYASDDRGAFDGARSDWLHRLDEGTLDQEVASAILAFYR
jgi:hypothetical protein